MSKHVYPAKFMPEDTGKYVVIFPDINECIARGDTMQQAFEMATEVLCACLWAMLDNETEIPAPSLPSDIELSENETVVLIGADVEAYRRTIESRAIKKTLSIPSWLNVKAESAGINFSQTLQKALKEELRKQL